jgi:hypothetical protein
VNEFAEKWRSLSKSERKQMRKAAEEEAVQRSGLRYFATNAQLKAAARKMVDQSISRALNA